MSYLTYMDKEPEKFDVDGFRVYLTEEDIEDIYDEDDISASNILKSECPVVAEGNWDSTGSWLFYKTHSENVEYDMTYTELKENVLVNKTDLI